MEPTLCGARDEHHAEQEEAHEGPDNRLSAARYHHRHDVVCGCVRPWAPKGSRTLITADTAASGAPLNTVIELSLSTAAVVKGAAV